MFGALLIIMVLPISDLGRSKGLQFRVLSKLTFYIFVFNFLTLLVLGAKHVESPFIEFGQISTFLYFSYFLFILPVTSLIENTLMDLELSSNNINKSSLISSTNKEKKVWGWERVDRIGKRARTGDFG